MRKALSKDLMVSTIKSINFKREQKEDIDTDQGDVFKSSLYEDSGADFSNFNTATDVENALASTRCSKRRKRLRG